MIKKFSFLPLYFLASAGLYASVATSGNWSTAETWSEGSSPTTSSSAVYKNLSFDADNITLNVDSTQYADRIQLGKGQTATINVASGAEFNLTGYVSGTSKHYLSGDTSYLNFTGDGVVNLTSGNECAFNNANVILDTTLKYTGTGWNSLALWGAGSLTVKKEIDLRDRQFSAGSWKVTVVNGATVSCGHTMSNSLNIDSGATFTAKSGMRLSNLILNGSLTCSGYRNYESTYGSEYYGIKLAGTSVIGANATLSATSVAAAANNLFSGNLTVAAGVGAINLRKNFYGTTGLILNLNSSNAFRIGDAATQGESTFNIVTYTREVVTGTTFKDKFEASIVTINLDADNDFGSFVFYDDSVLNLNANSHKVNIGSFNVFAEGMAFKSVNLGELVDFTIKIGSLDNISYHEEDGAVRADNVVFLSDGYEERVFLVADTQNGGFWLNSSIPEPSTYAAILGLFAMALAIYRKNK